MAADSDSDYIASSGDEAGANTAKAGRADKPSKGREKKAERWEEVQRAWDVGLEDDNIDSTVAELVEAGKKRRYNAHMLSVQLQRLMFIPGS